MYLNKVQKCPRVKSMMIVRLEFLGHGNADDDEFSTWGSGQRDGTDSLRRQM